jgi:hypothetical protein
MLFRSTAVTVKLWLWAGRAAAPARRRKAHAARTKTETSDAPLPLPVRPDPRRFPQDWRLSAPAARHRCRGEQGCCWCGSRQLLADQGVVSVQAGALMKPAGAGLVAASPVQPACGFPRRARQAAGPGIGAIFEQGGCGGADRQGGHDQHDATEDRGVQPGLALIQAEAVLADIRLCEGLASRRGARMQSAQRDASWTQSCIRRRT